MNRYNHYAVLIQKVSQEISDERGSKCGYDLMMGLVAGNHGDRAKAWEDYLEQHKTKQGHTDTERDGVWVPAIPLKLKGAR